MGPVVNTVQTINPFSDAKFKDLGKKIIDDPIVKAFDFCKDYHNGCGCDCCKHRRSGISIVGVIGDELNTCLDFHTGCKCGACAKRRAEGMLFADLFCDLAHEEAVSDKMK